MEDLAKAIGEINSIEEEIENLLQPIADRLQELESKKNIMQQELDRALKQEAIKQLSMQDYGCGTATIEGGPYKAKVIIAKKVNWDQSKLKKIKQQIIEAGQDYSRYIKEKLSVAESDYKNFDGDIKDLFESARTVERSNPKITIERIT